MAARFLDKEDSDYQFVKEPPSGLKCTICQAVARQPQQHGECGKLFCMSCLTQHTQFSSKCPNCALKLVTFYDGRSEKEIKTLVVKCDNVENGCQWTGKLESLLTHTRTCDYTTVGCPNHCERLQPAAKLLQKDLATHLDTCPARTHQCPHCSIMRPYHELITSHLEICPKINVYCPNNGCNQIIQRCYLDIHIATCQNILYPCKYANVRCPAQLKQTDLQAHEEDNQLHLQITKEKVSKLTQLIEVRERRFREHKEQMDKEIATLRQSLPSPHIPTAPIVFAVSNFYENQLLDKAVYSPSFQLWEQGYAFVLNVFPNGRGNGKYSHVSVFVRLTKGDSDDSLSWPFQGAVTVEILNQLEDKNHRKRKIVFSGNEDIFCRPTEGGENRGCGQNKFVSMKELGYSGYKNCQYLKDDKLYFRVW